MATPPRVFDLNRPYFVSTATLKRRRIFSDAANATLMRDVLYETSTRYRFHLLSFVIMPDHLHALIVPRPGDTISQVMRFIKGRYARLHNQRVPRFGIVWQPSFHDRAVRREEDLAHFIHYIEHNPVKAGLALDPKDYPFCSANPDCPTNLNLYLTGQG